MEKKGVEQKQKQKQIKKQFGLLFLWLRCVLDVAYLSLSQFGHFSFPSVARQLIESGPAFAGSRSQLVVTQSGSDPAARQGSVPWTDAI